MRQVAGCDDGQTCPGVFEDGDTVLVRGDMVGAVTLDRASGEAVVRLPAALLLEAARKLDRP